MLQKLKNSKNLNFNKKISNTYFSSTDPNYALVIQIIYIDIIEMSFK